jgi:biotin/methionine sulfoxide reductase
MAHRWNADGTGRGREPFVPVPWDEALDIAAEALQHAIETGGNESIYGGSYGWASAGRFHHAQGQLKRFYSAGAAEVITPHVLGMPFFTLMRQAPTAADIKRETDLVVCFGGIALKNTQVMDGGLGAHTAHDQMRELANSETHFVNVSPLKDDMADFVAADWWPCRPNSGRGLVAMSSKLRRCHHARAGAHDLHGRFARPILPRPLLDRLRALRPVPHGRG